MKNSLLHKIINTIRKVSKGNYNYFLWLFPVDEKKVVVSSYNGKGFGDNPRYIVEELIKRDNSYSITWLVKNKAQYTKLDFPHYIKTIEYGSFMSLVELAKAKYWIDNTRKSIYPPKRRNQMYIQTWHGGVALKRIEKDVIDKLDPNYVDIAIRDSKNINIMVSNSKFCTNMYRSAFWYDGDILEVGSPRCDVLFDDNYEVKKRVHDFFQLESTDGIVLYAPTFRNDLKTEVYDLNFDEVIAAFSRKFGSNWKILVRLHPNISSKSSFISYSDTIKNASDYPDMYELLAASDILITDYSSTMFEFSILKRPVFLYCNDYDKYKEERDFYFDISELPFILSTSNSDLIQSIDNFDSNNYLQKLTEFQNSIQLFEDGTASKKVVDYIIKKK